MLNTIKNAVSVLFSSPVKTIDSLANAADRFITTDKERKELKIELEKIRILAEEKARRDQMEFEKILEESWQAETEVKSELIKAEIASGDPYTRRARPSVIYAGIILAVFEALGLRMLILPSSEAVLSASNEMMSLFFMAWAGVVGVYSVGRTAEKIRLDLSKDKK